MMPAGELLMTVRTQAAKVCYSVLRGSQQNKIKHKNYSKTLFLVYCFSLCVSSFMCAMCTIL